MADSDDDGRHVSQDRRDSALAGLRRSIAELRTTADRFAGHPRPRTLLVVDDDEVILRIARRAVGDHPTVCEIITAGTVAAARNVLFTREVGVVILDQLLPDGHGVDIIDEVPRSAYLILISGVVQRDMLERIGKRAGASVYEKGGPGMVAKIAAEVERAFRGEI